jgi:hypothetical protein
MDLASLVNPFYLYGGGVRISVTDSTTKEQINGLVATQAMVLANPVWNKFLFSPWGISQVDNPDSMKTIGSGSEKEIYFSNDNSEALLVLLNIAHLRFSKVPKTELGYQMLYDLAILCDQYDCVELVKSWVDKWLLHAAQEIVIKGHEGWLFTVWVFGLEWEFEHLAMCLVESTISSAEECRHITGELCPNQCRRELLVCLLSCF